MAASFWRTRRSRGNNGVVAGLVKRFRGRGGSPLRSASGGGRTLIQTQSGLADAKWIRATKSTITPGGFGNSSNEGGYAMTSSIIRRAFLAAALALPLVTASGVAHADGERFVFVSHAPDSDSWWNTIKNALKNAEHDLGVKVEYRNPSSGDLADMARIVEQATASNPTGIIITIADYNVLETADQERDRQGHSGHHRQFRHCGTVEEARRAHAYRPARIRCGQGRGRARQGRGRDQVRLRQSLHHEHRVGRTLPGLCRRAWRASSATRCSIRAWIRPTSTTA